MAADLATLVVLPAGLHGLGLELPMTVEPLGPPPPLIARQVSTSSPRDVVSLFVPADPIDDQVRIAMTVVLDSGPAVEDVGQDFGDVRKKDDGYVAQVIKVARDALARLVRNKDITILRIEVDEVGSDGATLTLEYVNLRAPTRDNRRTFSRPV